MTKLYVGGKHFHKKRYLKHSKAQENLLFPSFQDTVHPYFSSLLLQPFALNSFKEKPEIFTGFRRANFLYDPLGDKNKCWPGLSASFLPSSCCPQEWVICVGACVRMSDSLSAGISRSFPLILMVPEMMINKREQ